MDQLAQEFAQYRRDEDDSEDLFVRLCVDYK